MRISHLCQLVLYREQLTVEFWTSADSIQHNQCIQESENSAQDVVDCKSWEPEWGNILYIWQWTCVETDLSDMVA